MGRCAIVILITTLMTFTCGMLGPVPMSAQESTPAATGVEISPGVTFELMRASEDPPSLYRLRFAPGATLSFVDDPAISLVYVESGATASRDQLLSKRQANAIKDYLVKQYQLSPRRLATDGRGSAQPIKRTNPASPVNRRVVVVNTSTVQ